MQATRLYKDGGCPGVRMGLRGGLGLAGVTTWFIIYELLQMTVFPYLPEIYEGTLVVVLGAIWLVVLPVISIRTAMQTASAGQGALAGSIASGLGTAIGLVVAFTFFFLFNDASDLFAWTMLLILPPLTIIGIIAGPIVSLVGGLVGWIAVKDLLRRNGDANQG